MIDEIMYWISKFKSWISKTFDFSEEDAKVPKELIDLNLKLKQDENKSLAIGDFSEDQGILQHLDYILKDTKVEILHVFDLNISTAEELDQLSSKIKNTNVSSINFDGNKINSPEALNALGDLLRSNNIKSVGLSNNGINSSEALDNLYEALEGSKVKHLIIKNSEELALNFKEQWKKINSLFDNNLPDKDIDDSYSEKIRAERRGIAIGENLQRQPY
ncbi:hypothetical protein N9W34_03345 [Rickettsiales bacterium]|nr:hypothetical protein [Rickettsiales bacterium]